MKFCTTCGRTYEDPEIDMCPHDGTPLFGMAGAEGQDLPDEEGASPDEVQVDAAAQVDDVAQELGADRSEELQGAQQEEEEEDIPLPGSTLPYHEEEDEDDIPLPGSTLPASDDDGIDEDLFVPPSEPEDDLFVAPSEPGEKLAPLDALDTDGLFGEDRDESLLSDDSEAMPDSAPVLGDALFDNATRPDYDIEVPGADDAASIQISEAIDNTLVDLGEDSEPEGDTSLANDYEPTSIPIGEIRPSSGKMADPFKDESSGGRGGLILVLLLIAVAAVAAWYFLAGPGAEKPIENTPVSAQQQDMDNVKQPDVLAAPDAGVIDQGDDAAPSSDAAADMTGDTTPDMDAPASEDDKPAGQTPPPVDPPKKDPPKKDPPKKDPPKKDPPKKDPPKKDPPKKDPEPKTDPPPEKKELKDELNNLLE